MNKTFTLVKGYLETDKKSKLYVQIREDDKLTYHNFKKKVSRWSAKYGRYNTVIRPKGEAEFYNLGGAIEGNFVLRRIVKNIDYKTVALGYDL